MLSGVQLHIDAVAAGDLVEQRVALINGSNSLSDEAKRQQGYFLKAFCWMAALDPFCGQAIQLEPGLTLHLNRSREKIDGNELPGVRTDSEGWLVLEGRFYRDGVRLATVETKSGNPLWPLMLRNVPAHGSGPWENFRPQVLEALLHVGRSWPQ